jgi:hypothetical protein
MFRAWRPVPPAVRRQRPASETQSTGGMAFTDQTALRYLVQLLLLAASLGGAASHTHDRQDADPGQGRHEEVEDLLDGRPGARNHCNRNLE